MPNAPGLAPVSALPDHELVARIRGGDELAFAEVVRRHRPRLLATARRLLAGTPHDPEDAVQDAFLRAHRSIQDGRDRTILVGGWLHVILRNRCLDLRRGWRWSGVVDEDVPARHADPADLVIERERLHELIADVAALPARQRAALAAHALTGASYEDLARHLDTTPGAVKAILNRARTRLATATRARSRPSCGYSSPRCRARATASTRLDAPSLR